MGRPFIRLCSGSFILLNNCTYFSKLRFFALTAPPPNPVKSNTIRGDSTLSIATLFFIRVKCFQIALKTATTLYFLDSFVESERKRPERQWVVKSLIQLHVCFPAKLFWRVMLSWSAPELHE